MISRIELLKKIDGLLGRLAASSLPASRKTATVAEPHRILVIRPGGIGDAVLLVPALVSLRVRYHGAHLTVLAERRNAAVFELTSAVDRTLCYDKPGELLIALCGRYDVVIDTEQWHRLSAVVARLTRSSLRIGFGTNERARLFTVPLPYSHDDYEALSFYKLLGPLGFVPPATIPPRFLFLPQVARQQGEELLAPLAGREYLVLFPGATVPERRWGVERFETLARRLEGEGWLVVVVGGKQDAAAGALIAGTAGLNLAGRTSLAVTAAVIGGARLLVSGDSGLLHLAVGLGTDTVSLFGPGRQRKWGVESAGNLIVNHHLPCSPCTTFGTTPKCPHQVRCMGEITVAELFRAAMGLLTKKNRNSLNKNLDINGGS